MIRISHFKHQIKRALLCMGISITVSMNAQIAFNQYSNLAELKEYRSISYVNENKKHSATNSFKKFSPVATPACERYADSYTMEDIPSFSRTQWSEHSNLLWGTYYKQYFEFNDGVAGYLFQGGISRNYFISNDQGDVIYFTGLRTAIRGLYIYKRFGCFTKYGRG